MKRYRLSTIGAYAMILIAVVTFSVSLRAQSNANRQAITHLCSIAQSIHKVWTATAVYYRALPNKTPDRVKLLDALDRGTVEILSDRSCEAVGVSTTTTPAK